MEATTRYYGEYTGEVDTLVERSRAAGEDFDVQAIKGDRPDLEVVADREIVRRIAAEQRTLVTNDVLDFQPI